MNLKLIAAAITILGLAACSPDITPQASTTPSGTVVSSAAAAEPAAEQPAAAPAVQEEQKDEAAAPAEANADEGEKKAD